MYNIEVEEGSLMYSVACIVGVVNHMIFPQIVHISVLKWVSLGPFLPMVSSIHVFTYSFLSDYGHEKREIAHPYKTLGSQSVLEPLM